MLIGRYEVLGELGAGGMGKVRLAKSPGGEIVVIKSALGESADDDERLRDEARVGLRLSHKGVVETLDLFDFEGRPHLVVAYVSGGSILDVRRGAPLPPAVVCRVGRQIADALDALHHTTDERDQPLHMLHRDVTPGNVMLGHDGNARLIDLGIARSDESRANRTSKGCLRGTLRYLAPELFDNKPHSAQSDLWALGVVLWEALLGRTAIRGSEAECIGKILSGRMMVLEDGERAPHPKVEKLVATLLAKKPGDRPRRARDVAAMFGMLEKELGDSEAQAQRAVARAVGPPRELSSAQDSRALLVESAAATFCAPEVQLLPTGFIEVSAADLAILSETGALRLLAGALDPRQEATTGHFMIADDARGPGHGSFGDAAGPDVSTFVEPTDIVVGTALAASSTTSSSSTRSRSGASTVDVRPAAARAQGHRTAEYATPADQLKAYAALLQHLERTPPPMPSPLLPTSSSTVAAPAGHAAVVAYGDLRTAHDAHPEPTAPPTTAERLLAREHKRAGSRLLVGVGALLFVTAVGVVASLVPASPSASSERVVGADAPPSCGTGQGFLFPDGQGGLVVAKRFADVPHDRVASVACVPLKE